MEPVLSFHGAVFGDKVSLPTENPDFAFSIPKDGSLPLDGALPSIIDHWGDSSYVELIPDLGARLHSLILEHPEPTNIEAIYSELSIDRPPVITRGNKIKYRAMIETMDGMKELT
jgi:hypothetical protein